jgi:hypothetical protein
VGIEAGFQIFLIDMRSDTEMRSVTRSGDKAKRMRFAVVVETIQLLWYTGGDCRSMQEICYIRDEFGGRDWKC